MRSVGVPGAHMTTDSASATSVTLDAEGRRLQLEAEKAKLRQATAEADRATAQTKATDWQSLVPDVETPDGTVTVGEGSGALGPWLAHRKLAQAAKNIAAKVKGSVRGSVRGSVEDSDKEDKDSDKCEVEGSVDTSSPRVLVVTDPALLDSDAIWTQVRQVLDRATSTLEALDAAVEQAEDDLDAALAKLDTSATTPDSPTGEDDVPAGGTPDDGGITDGIDADRGDGGETITGGDTLPGTVSGALGAAIGLAQLLRADHSLTSATVSSSGAELAVLVTAFLAKDGVAAELRGFSLTPDGNSPLLDMAGELATRTEKVAVKLLQFEARVAPWAEELDDLARRRDAFASLMLNTEGPAERVDELRQRWRDAADGYVVLSRAVTPARSTAAAVAQRLAQVTAQVDALLATPAGGTAPLIVALATERLHGADGKRTFTHVLYVHTEELNSDVVTRTSVLGSSGRVGFIGTATTTWLLLETGDRRVVGGGAVDAAGRMTYDLATGAASGADIRDDEELGPDPQDKLETRVRSAIVAVAFAALLIALVQAAEFATSWLN